ncbi:3-oxoacyl-ACP reductase FabG [Paenisporosarcina sp. TG20]|uniref:3-oxoacyl-ACP reductase FabG n=1 Tax=Paenisporosarcina sp. TG20 TaxID=1211706 RepID=UPI0002DA1156|nr:3-oxoacyl-ACP reductase FabG [Paenisporosarcina sp. TG20]
MRLKNNVAIITGGANGIGYAAVERFAEEGAQVIIADYDEVKGIAAASHLNEQGYDVTFIQVNVADRESVQTLIDHSIERYGGIDILVNNAGITRDAIFSKMDPADFQQVLDVNLNGVFYCTQSVLPHLIEKGKGKIINTSSVSGVYGNFGQTNYAASKAAVIGMTKSLAKEIGRKGINVNAVAPGFTRTAMVDKMPDNIIEKMTLTIALQRLATPKDIANAYLFLASSESDYVHGHVLHVDGGIMM